MKIKITEMTSGNFLNGVANFNIQLTYLENEDPILIRKKSINDLDEKKYEKLKENLSFSINKVITKNILDEIIKEAETE